MSGVNIETILAVSKAEVTNAKVLAAGQVPVEDYLQLRFSLKKVRFVNELEQMGRASRMINQIYAEQGRLYHFDPSAKVKRSFDPLTVWARHKTAQMPFADFLRARVVAINQNIKWQEESLEMFGFRENVEEDISGAKSELNLTLSAAEAAGITIGDLG